MAKSREELEKQMDAIETELKKANAALAALQEEKKKALEAELKKAVEEASLFG